MQKHGTVDLSWQENLLVVQTFGPFNEEAIEYIIAEAKKTVKNRPARLWKRLEILDEETLASPAVLARVKELNTWFEDNGCMQVAVVVCNEIQVYVTEKVLNSYAKIFRDAEAAKKWLGGQGE